LPDFRKLGVDPHARFVGRVFQHLSEGSGHIPHQWFADEIARLDRTEGDVETLAGRIAGARSWAYIAHRTDWLLDPHHWAGRTRAVEERLSDALHASLQQRFVDKRTTVLLRKIGADASMLPVTIGPQGEVQVEDHVIGTLDGFRFSVATDARAGDKKMLLAAAEKRLSSELRGRGEALVAAPGAAFALIADDRGVPGIAWDGHRVARLLSGTSPTRPRVELDRALACLDRALRDAALGRVEAWLGDHVRKLAPGLAWLDRTARDPQASPPLRAIATALGEAGGIAPRADLGGHVDALDGDTRRALRKAGFVIGTLDLFDPRLLKPQPAALRQMLIAARNGGPVADTAPDGATVLPAKGPAARLAHGFRPIGMQAVRVDLVERIARAAHDARVGRTPFVPDPSLAISIGIGPATFARLMVLLGFRSQTSPDGPPRWTWRGRQVRREAVDGPARPDNAFAALRELGLG
jgi:ATP-dependent RNA helicase SUPV3L1/SUV3